MKKVVIRPGCIGCGLCAHLLPEVFVVENYSRVKDDVSVQAYLTRIQEVARQCPMQVIEVKEEYEV